MALATTLPLGTEQTIVKLLAQLNSPEEQSRLLAQTRMMVKSYEEKFGLRSEQIHDAIDSGELAETVEVCHWIFQYDILRRVTEQ